MKYYKKDVNIVNIGHNNFITVKQSIKYITNHLSLSPRLIFSSKKVLAGMGTILLFT